MLHFRCVLGWTYWWPSVRAGLGVVGLFAAALWVTQYFAAPIHDVLSENVTLGLVVLFVSSVVAVLMPMLSNLALIPAFVLTWGPWWTALILLCGWVVGAALSFSLGRYARNTILRHFPSVQRHAKIDRLIHPQHRLGSLILLRMTFPVDVLSYALGMFSTRTTLTENAVSTTLGAAPFALLFSLLPALSGTVQMVVFGASVLLFVAYAFWILDRSSDLSSDGDDTRK